MGRDYISLLEFLRILPLFPLEANFFLVQKLSGIDSNRVVRITHVFLRLFSCVTGLSVLRENSYTSASVLKKEIWMTSLTPAENEISRNIFVFSDNSRESFCKIFRFLLLKLGRWLGELMDIVPVAFLNFYFDKLKRCSILNVSSILKESRFVLTRLYTIFSFPLCN